MTKYSKPDDVYAELVDRSHDNWLLGLVAFSIIEEQRIEWAKHVHDQTGAWPTDAEIKSWYESQPPAALIRARGEAESALLQFGAAAVDEFESKMRDEIRDGLMMAEIKSMRKLWPQFFMNVVSGIVGSFVFAAILGLLWFVLTMDVSPQQLADRLKAQSKEHNENPTNH